MATKQQTLKSGYAGRKKKKQATPAAKKPQGPQTKRTESRRVYSHTIVNRVTTTTRAGNQTRSTSTWTKMSR